jgi:cold shock protein
MQKGTIVRKNDKGFGFIAVEGRDKDLFFHANELQGVTWDDIREGDVVEFEVADGPKGPNAINVQRAGAEV